MRKLTEIEKEAIIRKVEEFVDKHNPRTGSDCQFNEFCQEGATDTMEKIVNIIIHGVK